MIVEMAKIEIAGRRECLDELLSLLKESGMVQVETRVALPKEKELAPERKAVTQRTFLENMAQKIESLLAELPSQPERTFSIVPERIVHDLSKTVGKHSERIKRLKSKRDHLYKRLSQLKRMEEFLLLLKEQFPKEVRTPDIELVGLLLKDEKYIEDIKRVLDEITDGKSELIVQKRGDTHFGIVIVKKDYMKKLRKALFEKGVPEIDFPPRIKDSTFDEKLKYIRTQREITEKKLDETIEELNNFTKRWGPLYLSVLRWINERFMTLKVRTYIYESEMCFFLYGWLPRENIDKLRRMLEKRFKGRVVLKELEIAEEDLEWVPVMLRNPAYFQPFEIFTRLLPLPKYTSYDPTVFIGIFFPLFFGMILGDVGYAIILMLLSVVLLLRSSRRLIQDAAKVLLVCSAYTLLFGILYGEFFGGLAETIGLHPVVDRRKAIIPMVYFTLSVGAAHILLGFFLSIVKSLKKRVFTDVVVKGMIILLILLISVSVFSFKLFKILLPLQVVLFLGIIILGGIMAPLEFIKSFGNIISYVRIMAIGLSSVFLAEVANTLAGSTGDILLGILVACILHSVNIAVGVFSPAIHSLRLHFVEFFSKFLEHGGRKFVPLGKGE